MKTIFNIIVLMLIGVALSDYVGCMHENNRRLHQRQLGHVAQAANNPSPPTDRTSFSGSGICADFDPVNRPGDAYKILLMASGQTGTPPEILYGIWQVETAGEVYGDQGGAGGCSVLQQYDIRDHWKPGYGSTNRDALATIQARSGARWNVATLQGSCGRSTMATNVKNFGGCIGPMQITPEEWVRDGFADKDPLNLCWAMVATGERLKRHHDERIQKGQSDADAWNWAVGRYFGSASGTYITKVSRNRETWREWQRNDEIEARITRNADRQGRKWRQSSLVARN